jgi:16S rRNA processing protein RimM
MSEKNFELRLVGIIGKPHGIKGEVILNIISDYPNTVIPGLVLMLRNPAVDSLEIEDIKNPDFCIRKSAIIKFKGINDRNAAEALRGEELYRKNTDLPETPEDFFWIDDLLGCVIEDSQGNTLARVVEVAQGKANDNLFVKKISDDIKISGVPQKHFYIPLTKEYIREIDTKAKKIVINKIPEYI